MKVSVRQNEKLINERKKQLKRIFAIIVSVLLIFFFASSTYAQNTIKVSGHVANENGQPIPKASIVVKGTKTGVTSNDNGDFQISASSNAVLVISSVGYTTLEIRVNNQETLTVNLTSVSGNMNEVVVVGYGTQRKEAVTGSVASINGDKMREVPSANISQALQGRIAGVEMSQTNTRPGAIMQIRVRGARSLSADNNPLIVLDGIPFLGSLNDINPDDIKSIEILKDASATAIYGSRGANGVILVTTDKGSRNKYPRINYRTYVGMQKIFAKYPMMDGPQFVALRTAAGQYTNGQDEV